MSYALIYRGRPWRRAEPVPGGRSSRRPRGGLDQSLSGSVLRPRAGLAHFAWLCFRPFAVRALVGRSSFHRRSNRAGAHFFFPTGLHARSGQPTTTSGCQYDQHPRLGCRTCFALPVPRRPAADGTRLSAVLLAQLGARLWALSRATCSAPDATGYRARLS